MRATLFRLFIVLTFSLFAVSGFAATLYGIAGGNSGDLYIIDPVTGTISLGFDLPNAPVNGVSYQYQSIAFFRDDQFQERFFMVSYPTGNLSSQISIYNNQTFTPYVHLFDGTDLLTFDLSSVPGYSASWFDRGPASSPSSSIPWLNGGAGYFAGSVYLTVEYLTTIGGRNLGFMTYPFFLKLDLNSNFDGFSSVSKIDISDVVPLPTDQPGNRTLGDTGDLAFIKNGSAVGNFFLSALTYNGGGGSALDLERVAYTGNIAQISDGQIFISDEPGTHPSPWAFDGVAELDGVFYTYSIVNGEPGTPDFLIIPRLHTIDPITGDILTTIDTTDINLSDLTSSYNPVLADPVPVDLFSGWGIILLSLILMMAALLAIRLKIRSQAM